MDHLHSTCHERGHRREPEIAVVLPSSLEDLLESWLYSDAVKEYLITSEIV